MMMSIRDYRHGDAAKVLPRWDFKAEHEAEGSPLFNGPPQGLAYTLVRGPDEDRGLVRACGGAIDQGDGCWSLWGYGGTDMDRREWCAVARKLAWLLGEIESRGGRQVQALVRPDNPGAFTFLRRLGFRQALFRVDGLDLLTFSI